MQTTYEDNCVIVNLGIEVGDVLESILFDLEDYCHLVFISVGLGSEYYDVLGGLIRQGFVEPVLLMREEGDRRNNTVVKEAIYEDCIMGNWNVRLVFDSNSRAVKMWRSKGLTCYQVAEGDF